MSTCDDKEGKQDQVSWGFLTTTRTLAPSISLYRQVVPSVSCYCLGPLLSSQNYSGDDLTFLTLAWLRLFSSRYLHPQHTFLALLSTWTPLTTQAILIRKQGAPNFKGSLVKAIKTHYPTTSTGYPSSESFKLSCKELVRVKYQVPHQCCHSGKLRRSLGLK